MHAHNSLVISNSRTNFAESKMFSWRNSKGVEEPSPCDEAVKELYKHIDDFHNIMKRETNKLRKEKEAFDEAAKKLEHVHFSEILKLNVGGTTTLHFRTPDPRSEKSKLKMTGRAQI